MSDARPPIPTNVMREVRQRCGFGCVLCGTPICEYHHMVPYSESPEHVASNITLLCNLHHTEATKGLLTSDQIARANENPYCRQHGVTSPYSLHFSGEGFACVIGGNSFSSPWRDQEHSTLAIAIAVDDTDLLWFRVDQDGRLFVNASIFDEYNLPLLIIQENAMVYSADKWDVEFKGRNLIVRQASREIFIEIRFEPPDKLCIDRARLLCNGVEILVRSSHIFVVNSDLLFTGCKTVQNCGVGLQLGRNIRGYKAVVNCPKLSRFHLSAPESKKREKLALEGMKKNLEDLRVLVDPEIST
jgi:trigger factor